MQFKGEKRLKGLDLSHWVKNIDLENAAKDGFSAVYLKATEGEHSCDSELESLYLKAKAAGLAVGFYHFLHVGGEYSAQKEAENFLSVLKKYEYSLLPAVDIEDGGFHSATKEETTKAVLTFAEKIKKETGKECVLYSNTSFIAEHLTADAAALPLWAAHYGVSAPGENGIFSDYVGWQYTGSAPYGGEKNVDMDVFSENIFIKEKTAESSENVFSEKDFPEDVYAVKNPPYEWNAAAKVDFDVRNKEGVKAPGREVFAGDRITILSVDYEKQLAEIVYPTKSGFMHGYIKNLQTEISDRYHFKWQNGSTNEKVFNAENKEIGTIFAREKATPLYRRGGKTAVIYNTVKGEETKFGFVSYGGKFTF